MKKKSFFLAVIATTFAFGACSGGSSESTTSDYGYEVNEYNVAFGSAAVSRPITLYSPNGGIEYGYGTFYDNGTVVLNNPSAKMKAVQSDSPKWNYMIVWYNGERWYFD